MTHPSCPFPPMSEETFSLKRIAIPAFGPSLMYGICNGAIMPVVALSARELGASVAVSGFIAALVGIGSLFNNIPAALIASRFGERRSIIGAAFFSMMALLVCALAGTVWLLGAGVFMVGMAASIFLLARQAYLAEAVPLYLRARAMATLGGTTRIGSFFGPFAGAAAIHFMGLSGAYLVAAIAMFVGGALAWWSPELEARPEARARPANGRGPTMMDILRSHYKVFATLGVGIMLVAVLRSSRQVVIPLWADHLGLAPTLISLIYGLVAAIDMSVFYPAGKVMDKYGRMWVAVPCTLLMGLSLLAMPFTSAPVAFVIVALVLGFGNGIGSGIVMTLAADASPVNGRTRFLGLWRLMSDIGASGGPALIAGITGLASLATGIFTIGLAGLLAAWVFWRWLPHAPPGRTANAPTNSRPSQ